MSSIDLQDIYKKVDDINRELGTLITNVKVLDERCSGIDSKIGMVWKLQLAVLGILVAAVAGGIWFVLTVATRIIFK